MQHYTYAHYKPDGSVFYIGKGRGGRAFRTGSRNQYWNRTVAKHGSFTAQILCYWKTNKEALEHESFLISCFRDIGVKLVNLTTGGDGGNSYARTPEIIEKQRKALAGRPCPTKGIKRKPLSEETKEKMRAAHTGRKTSEDAKVNLSKALKGKKKTETHKKNLAIQLIEARKKMKSKKGVARPTQTCPHCDKVGGLGNMTRWHFDNCKDKK